ncbi:inositol hexakisphosphate-domain-containing protein [Pilobolus umbonatus]|nr:inositol hexakisphosphate-domain-containing protein [Pilobolus umbonatus]
MSIHIPRDNSNSSLSSSPKSQPFSLYAESSSTRRGSIHDSPSSQRKYVEHSNEAIKNFVPPRFDISSHSRQCSAQNTRPAVDHTPLEDRQNTNLYPEYQLHQPRIIDPTTLLRIAPTIVKTRKGSVLARNTILKMDHFLSGTNTNLDFHLQGAPNFRMAELNVYGVAQPTAVGLSTILTILSCHPKSVKSTSCAWFSTREEPLVYLNGIPYVLREYADPLKNMSAFLGINSVRLEKVEERLKSDVKKEAKSLGGLLLVHQELSDGTIVPCYIAADRIETPKEVFESFQVNGYRLKYFRIPISPVQAPEDNYFDEYINVIRSLEPTDPLVFNCGIGAVRTTVGVIIAQIIRRTQLIERGYPDPFPIPGWSYHLANQGDFPEELDKFVKGIEEVENANTRNQALLRLMHVLEKALESKGSPQSSVEWLLERGSLIENLKEAIMGNYQSIVSLTAVLESGTFSKKLLDTIIDKSDAVLNLRESILSDRIRQTTQTKSDNLKGQNYLSRALDGLQRYFFLLCFTVYVNESPNTRFEERFSSWVRARSEIWSMLQNMRKKGPRLYFFRPVEDLHCLNPPSNNRHGNSSSYFGKNLTHVPGMFDMTGAGFQTNSGITVEMEEFIINSRTGVVLTSQTILKVDFWHYGYMFNEGTQTPNTEKQLELSDQEDYETTSKNKNSERHHNFYIDGASNFRRIENTNVYGVAQPTVNGLRQVIRNLLTDNPVIERILWINLREEPIIYINGIPYVLRDRAYTLRNLRAYKGITGSRMEQLEERLKQDVIREVMHYGGRILLHGEDSDGNVLASWEEVDVQDILTVREVMESAGEEMSPQSDTSASSDEEGNSTEPSNNLMNYCRVPITSEKAPEWRDFDDLCALVTRVDLNKTAIIMNCQVGLGRSTTGTIIATLLTRWIRPKLSFHSSNSSVNGDYKRDSQLSIRSLKYPNYQIINSLLRVIKHGLEIKRTVDTTIIQCSVRPGTNLINTIESARIEAEKEKEDDYTQFKRIVKRGITSLERYFMFICFQAYLDSTSPSLISETESFTQWIKRHPELGTILQELLHISKNEEEGFKCLVPVGEVMLGDGMALSSEVMQVVSARHGQVLAQQTILKHDAFPGCQKMNLREKIPGAYNFRRVEIKEIKSAVKYGGLAATFSGLAADLERDYNEEKLVAPFIAGCAMPNKNAIKAILKEMNAGPGGRRWVFWTCLREEPVLYVNKNPYVLRLFVDPLKNLETTGISKERVEGMEYRMKLDVIQELREYDGRMLLHDEEALEKGGFNLLPLWETVPIDQVQTPSEIFDSIRAEGYQVDYLRIPITDEQAPIPDVFDQLICRMHDANQDVDVLFNCQMGRGRTTTGMIVASLLSMILSNDAIGDMTDSFLVESSSNSVGGDFDGLYDNQDDNDESHEERERYQNGEYRCILQLVSVLNYGKIAKRLTDQAINMCDHMQNLRKAIYDYKLRIEAMPDQGSKKWRAAREVAVNYLVRYFYLIVFANYLLEEMGNINASSVTDEETEEIDGDLSSTAFKEARKLTTFKKWLKGRREISNIISLQPVELS